MAKSPTLLSDTFCQELAKLSTEEQQQILSTLQRVAEMMHAPEVGDVPYLFNEG